MGRYENVMGFSRLCNTFCLDSYEVFTSSHMSTPIHSWQVPKNIHLHILMVVNYCFRVYRTTSKYCRIMARRILNNTMSSMITSDPQSRIFWCFNSVWYSCYRDNIIAPKTIDSLRDPICIFFQVSFLFNPQNWVCSMMPHWTWTSSTRNQGRW